MNIAQLQNKFSHAINWNALSYLFYKISSTLFSFFLFSSLTTADFSLWANTHSIIFLSLLLIDCGLRKSIPRFYPEFARQASNHKTFIITILCAQLAILIIATPLITIIMAHLIPTIINSALPRPILYSAVTLFFAEGIIAVLRTTYHAHFLQKKFNIIHSLLSLAEIISSIIIVLHTDNPLLWLLITKIITGTLLIIICIHLLPSLYTDAQYRTPFPNTPEQTWRPFIKHSAMMWCSTTIKSLSERNVMLPLLTYLIGPAPANIYKVANDGALLFYRSITKTIGTSDTTILAHATMLNDESALKIAFQRLHHTIAQLSTTIFCLLITGAVITYYCFPTLCHTQLPNNPLFITLFLTLTLSYTIETVLSPYERILEVRHQYLSLTAAYIPYIIGMIIIIPLTQITECGLLPCIISIQLVRLTGSFLMMYAANKKYQYQLCPPKKIRLMFTRALLSPLWIFIKNFSVMFTTPKKTKNIQ